MNDADYLVFKAIAKILIRKGVITPQDIEGEVDDLGRSGLTSAAHNLEMLHLEASAMTASQFEADYRRRQMIERTAYLSRKADDGKPED